MYAHMHNHILTHPLLILMHDPNNQKSHKNVHANHSASASSLKSILSLRHLWISFLIFLIFSRWARTPPLLFFTIYFIRAIVSYILAFSSLSSMSYLFWWIEISSFDFFQCYTIFWQLLKVAASFAALSLSIILILLECMPECMRRGLPRAGYEKHSVL